jgi:hypothetical protein
MTKKKICEYYFVLENLDVIYTTAVDDCDLKTWHIDRTFHAQGGDPFHTDFASAKMVVENAEKNLRWSDPRCSAIDPIERLIKARDVTRVGVKYTDETEDVFQIEWTGDGDFSDDGQKTAIDENGVLTFETISERR